MKMYCVVDTGRTEIFVSIQKVYGPFLTRHRAMEFAGKFGYSGDQGLSSGYLVVFEMEPDPNATKLRAMESTS